MAAEYAHDAAALDATYTNTLMARRAEQLAQLRSRAENLVWATTHETLDGPGSALSGKQRAAAASAAGRIPQPGTARFADWKLDLGLEDEE